MRVIAGLSLSLILLGACLLADPPGDPPKTEPRRPAIQHEAVDPPLWQVLTDISTTKLVIPVDADPQAQLVYKIFLDFDPATGGVPIDSVTLKADVTLSPTRIVTIDLASYMLDTTRCHSLLVRVAVDFSQTSNWTPSPPGGDDALWYYRPNGMQGACPGFDAGTYPDASAFDTGADE